MDNVIEEGVLDNSENGNRSQGSFVRPILDQSIQSGFLNRSSLEGSIQSRKLLRSSLEGSVQLTVSDNSRGNSHSFQSKNVSSSITSVVSGPLNASDDASSILVNDSIHTGTLERSGRSTNESLSIGVFDHYPYSETVDSGTLNLSDTCSSLSQNQSYPPGFLDKYFRVQSNESLSDTRTSLVLRQSSSNQSVEAGFLEASNQSVRSSLNGDEVSEAKLHGDYEDENVHIRSNRSSISTKSSSKDSFHSQYSSEEEMKEVSSFQDRISSNISSPADLENMMLEVGNLNTTKISPSGNFFCLIINCLLNNCDIFFQIFKLHLPIEIPSFRGFQLT